MTEPNDASTSDEMYSANHAHWEEFGELHSDTSSFDISAFLDGNSTLTEVEREALGNVADKSIVHLQSHLGLDTLSLARLGADVVGLDFSASAIDTARRVRDEANLDTEFVEANVYDAPEVLDRRFDVVFASFGVLPWVSDLEEWMAVAAELAKPGGRLCLIDEHPILAAFDLDFEPVGSYFREGAKRQTEQTTYAARDTNAEQTTVYTWQHRIGEVVTMAIEAGFRIETLREHPYLFNEGVKELEEDQEGRYRIPGDPVPTQFVLTAERS